MSLAYQSWEVTSGPSMGFKMSVQGTNNGCSSSDSLSPYAPIYSGSRQCSSESFFRRLVNDSDTLKNLVLPNSKVLTHQDIAEGLSSLSLHPPQQTDVRNNTDINLSRVPNNQSTIPRFAAGSSEYCLQGRKPVVWKFAGLTHSPNCYGHQPDHKMTFPTAALPSSDTCPSRDLLFENFHCVPHAYDINKHELGIVVEERALEEDSTMGVCHDLELDSLSASSTDSFSSVHRKPTDLFISSSDGSNSTGESKGESEYKGFSSSVGTTAKKGLSQFYAGKSRSFSCLADVVSVKDLAKPEIPYAKKRKYNLGRGLNVRAQLPPLQKGAASISKKLPHNGKVTLALAVAMSAKGDGIEDACAKDAMKCASTQKGQGTPLMSTRSYSLSASPLSTRSYSLSDLQGV